MAKYYVVEPEVAGGFGINTVFTRTEGKPMVVHKLHYEFDGWLGDSLLETTPCYIVRSLAFLKRRSGQWKCRHLSFSMQIQIGWLNPLFQQ